MSVERPAFPLLRFREAYDAEQVDLAVEMAVENLSLPHPRIGRGDIEALRFAPVRRGGYDMTAVDDWFDEVAAELDRRAGVQPEATGPGSVPVPTEAPSGVVDLGAGEDEDNELVRLLVKVAVVVVLALLFYLTFA